MNLDDDACYRALRARDARFDGVFLTGVTTTRIYCRPVCPARTPRRESCRFYPHAAAAERDGFRPCLRCRPELAPGQAPVDAARRLARLAAERIDAGAWNGGGLKRLAADFGTSPRHLRRVVREEFGASPIQLAQTRRLLLAKQLLTETDMPVIDVAFASGFESVRRFNALFRSRYRLAPTGIRRRRAPAPGGDSIRLTVAYRPPFAWPPLLRFFEERIIAGVEHVDGNAYYRTAAVGAHRGWFQVSPAPDRDVLFVDVSAPLTPELCRLLSGIRCLFDLDARPDVIADHLSTDSIVGPLVRRNPGLRIPGAIDEFEMLIRAILGQRISVKAATTLAGRLAAACGEPVETPFPFLSRLVPTAATLAATSRTKLRSLGLSGQQADCIRTVSQAVANGELTLFRPIDPVAAMGRLQQFPGIGEWTAQYVALRAFRWPDAFPAGDLGLRKATGQTALALQRTAEAWRPWRAYAARHLWESLRDRETANRYERVTDEPSDAE